MVSLPTSILHVPLTCSRAPFDEISNFRMIGPQRNLIVEKWWGQWVFNVDNFSEFRVPAPITGLCLIIADVM